MGQLQDQINNISQRFFQGETLTEDDIDFAYKSLLDPDSGIVTKAGMIVTGLTWQEMTPLISNFKQYPIKTQLILIPLIAGIEQKEAFKFLFELLLTTTKGPVITVVTNTLAVTQYPVIPYLFLYISRTTTVTEARFIKLVRLIGFSRLKTSLKLFPHEIPGYSIFEQAFGKELMKSIKA